MQIEGHRKILLAAMLALLLVPLPANRANGGSSVKASKLTAGSDAGLGNNFGHSIAVSGDTMVFGAPYEDAAYVFEQDNGKWKKVARLSPNGSTSFFGFFFGWSVAISGNTIVVGAPYESFPFGSAYVFKREGDIWDEEPKTQLKAGDFSLLFGWSLAFEGGTLVVGTAMSNSVYVYNPDGAKWPDEEARLTVSDAGSNSRFGWSVAISGTRLVVGAPRDESMAGSAYVFDFDGAGWLETAKLTASDKAEHDNFGFSVAIHQDTVVVGAHKDSSNLTPPATIYGAAYVFEFDGSNWSEKLKLTASVPEDYDQFGYSVAIKGSTLLVGAPFDSTYGPKPTPGAAYVFETDGSTWSEKLKLTASDAGDPPQQDQFGFAAAINGTTLVVGAILADAEIHGAGAAYVFEANEPPVAVATWDQEEGVVEGDLVTLDGSDSYDPDGDQLTYLWEQTGGPDVGWDVLLAKHDPTDPKHAFVAPELSEGCAKLSFQLTVMDDKGLASEPATVDITVYPNNRIHAKLEGKHRQRLHWHKYSFYGHEDEQVTIRLEADSKSWHRGRRATLILKDKIKGARLFQTNRDSLHNDIRATLPADGKYTVYVLNRPRFWRRHERHKRFEGDYILTLEGTCGKLVKGSQRNKR